MEIWQNLEKQKDTDYDFPPPYTNKILGAENNEARQLLKLSSRLPSIQYGFMREIICNACVAF